MSEVIGGESFQLMNLKDQEVEKRIIDEMGQGISVFYDRRWEVTSLLTYWLGKNVELFEGKRGLVLGAGVGAETLLLGRWAGELFLNDLSPVALELCVEQLEQNAIRAAGVIGGRYEEEDLPEVDFTVGSFLVYDDETLASMREYLETGMNENGGVILMNENLPAFQRLCGEVSYQTIFEKDGAKCVLFGGGDDDSSARPD